MEETAQSSVTNPTAMNPFEFPEYDWNGRRMVPRRINFRELKRRIDAQRGDTIYTPVHIPVEEATV